MERLEHLKLLSISHSSNPLSEADREFLRQHPIGSICLFRGQLTDLNDIMDMIEDMYNVMGPNVFVSVDQEGGSVVRLPQLPVNPGGLALASANDPELTYRTTLAMAKGLRAVGINVNFGPVLDINNNPDNPVIGDRAMGLTAEQVSLHAVPYIKAHLDAGVLAVGKHFPGHGDTAVDSHHGLPVVDKSLAELEANELAPFRAAIAAGMDAIMTAHIVFPQIDSAAATLSKPVLDLARRDGWDGLIFTDAMDMKAILDLYPQPVSAALSLKAGADIPLTLAEVPPHVFHDAQNYRATPVDHLSLVTDYHPDPQDVARSVVRFDRLVAKYPFGKPDRAQVATLLADQSIKDDMYALARKAVAPYGNPQLPLKPSERVLFIVPTAIKGGMASGQVPLDEHLYHYIQAGFPNATLLDYDPEGELPTLPDLSQQDSIVFVTARGFAPWGSEVALANAIAAHPHALHVNLLNPYLGTQLPLSGINTFGFTEASLQALVDALLTGELHGILRFDWAQLL